jgi:hypothetical protein
MDQNDYSDIKYILSNHTTSITETMIRCTSYILWGMIKIAFLMFYLKYGSAYSEILISEMTTMRDEFIAGK